jgi:tetratricopeptide (TPR) repeat protein
MMENEAIVSQHSVDLNNTGVAFLESGNYAQAVSALTSALGLVKQELAANDLISTEPRTTQFSNRYSSKIKFEFRITETPGMVLSMTNNSKPSFIFRFPIKPKSGLTVVEMSVIIMFNLALALHLSGLENQHRRRLEKALSIYEYAFQIQTQEHVDLSDIFPLVILNNLGHIHTLLQNYEMAEMWFQDLLSSMLYILDQQSMERPREENKTLSSCWTGLLSNVTDLIFRASSAASAA